LASNLQQYMVVPVTICDLPCPIFRGTNSESEDKVSLNDGGEGFRRKPGTEIYVHPPSRLGWMITPATNGTWRRHKISKMSS